MKLNPTAQWIEPVGTGAAELAIAVYPDSAGVYTWLAETAGTVTRIWVGSTAGPAASEIRGALRVNGVETEAVATVATGESQASTSTEVDVAIGDALVVNMEGAASLGVSGLIRVDGPTPTLYRLMATQLWDGDVWQMVGGAWVQLVALYPLAAEEEWKAGRSTYQERSGAWRTIQ